MRQNSGWDGGNVKISVNGGPWTLIALRLISSTTPTMSTPSAFSACIQAPFSTNPIAGEQAFSGADGGSVDGSWGRSIINLTGYAEAGDDIQLRFDIGVDGCNGAFGWYVDDVNVYQCYVE